MNSGLRNDQGAFFLGVDGGGSKTAYCVLNNDGRTMAYERGAACHYMSSGVTAAERALSDGIAAVCRSAGITTNDLAFTVLGLPGYGEVADDTATLDAMPARILGHDRYRCVNDMVCGWAGSLGAVDGINIIAGTGSLAYGEYGGHQARCGGWGWRFGDEGSAYWIGSHGLNLFTRMSDGRQPHSALYDLFFEQLELADASEVIARFLHGSSARQRIAELAVIVLQAAEAGDTAAVAVIEQAARELTLIVHATRQKLGFDQANVVPMSYSGGLFKSARMVRELSACLDTSGTPYELREPLYTPEIGAAVYAARQIGNSVVPRKQNINDL